MVKPITGLPAGFNLNVSSEDLIGKPAELPDYLDHDPVLELAKMRRAQQQAQILKQAESIKTAEPTKIVEPVAATRVEPKVEVTKPDISTAFQDPMLDLESQAKTPTILAQTISAPAKLAIKPMPKFELPKALSHGLEDSKLDLEDLVKAQMQAAPAKGFVPTFSKQPFEASKVEAPQVRVEESFYQKPQTQPLAQTFQTTPNVQSPVAPQAQGLHVITSEPKLKKQRARRDQNRLQINFSPEAERKMYELLEMISAQGPQKDVMVSELMQALILNLYDARSEMNLSRLPLRGQWGSPTAKSFPAALAEAFREAQVSYDQKSGGNPFKKAVGG